mmetsp:Transcript_13535/g.31461  ORF Transcript_13535/g.31461 Transcript_13535/m.31461 type:complete len:313 (+) Transcript_13535:842-1780(+)
MYGHKNLVLAGLESEAPAWAGPEVEWVSCDLTTRTAGEIMDPSYKSLVIGVRAPLTTGDGDHESLLVGISSLLENAVRCGVLRVLHISSVAAVNHLKEQVMVREEEKMPPAAEYEASYDRFKRRSEELISHVCEANKIPYTHLRLGAIFSDTPSCIQSSALALQSKIGCYLPTCIDCNSSRNVAVAVRHVMDKLKRGETVQTLYYYTRPTKKPVAYGEYLKDYIKANNITFTIWIPLWLVVWFVGLIHWLVHNTEFVGKNKRVRSIDYLLQVSTREHTFNNSRFRKDFHIAKEEETIHDCFVRRKKLLDGKR